MKLVAIAVALAVFAPIAPAAAAESCEVDAASLTWGFKESFRAYIGSSIANGEWTVADGATYETPNFGFTDGSGSLASGVAFPGSIRFTGHGGILDTTVAHPVLRFDGATALLQLDVAGTTQDGVPIDSAGVDFVTLDLGAATITRSATHVTVEAAPATLTQAGADAFGTYPAGEQFDAVSFDLNTDAACAEQFGRSALPWLWWVAGALLLAAAVAAVVLRQRRRRRAQRPGA